MTPEELLTQLDDIIWDFQEKTSEIDPDDESMPLIDLCGEARQKILESMSRSKDAIDEALKLHSQ